MSPASSSYLNRASFFAFFPFSLSKICINSADQQPESDLFTFVIMLYAIITLVLTIHNHKK